MTDLCRQKGFTLLEVLLASAILAIVMSLIYAPFTGAFDAINFIEPEAETYHVARVVLARIVEDLESANPDAGVQAGPEADAETTLAGAFVSDLGQGDASASLSFVSMAHLTFSGETSSYRRSRISYSVEEAEDGGGMLLYRLDMPELAVAAGSGRGLVLCDRIESVAFTFYDKDGGSFERWNSLEEDFQGSIPRMVTIDISFINDKDPEDPFRFVTSVILPAGKEI